MRGHIYISGYKLHFTESISQMLFFSKNTMVPQTVLPHNCFSAKNYTKLLNLVSRYFKYLACKHYFLRSQNGNVKFQLFSIIYCLQNTIWSKPF